MDFKLKDRLLLGTASSAMQIEGGDCDSSWNDWYRKGKILDSSNPARANDHWHRWQEDADLMAELGIQSYRFGIEWARLIPEEGMIDQAAIERYRQEMIYLKEKGIGLLLTIQHFANPMWFEEKGGFARRENNQYFLQLVRLAVESFGDLVSEYITINEPNVYATHSYWYGIWPPGRKSFKEAAWVMSNLAECHILAYRLIHELRRDMGQSDTKVSIAIHLRVFEAARPFNLKDRFFRFLIEKSFQGSLLEACSHGRFSWPLKGKAERGDYCDFLAVNYYSRSFVKGKAEFSPPDLPKNDLGWEIHPQGIIPCLRKASGKVSKPIYITENGTCDNEDEYRSRFIYDHLKAICESELPVERYYHWCFCDNFELLEGESARFGLVHVDFESQRRRVKKSGRFYAGIIRSHGVTKELYEDYVKGEEYPV